MNGYEIVYPFKANDNGNKREFSTNVDGTMLLYFSFCVLIYITGINIEMKMTNAITPLSSATRLQHHLFFAPE